MMKTILPFLLLCLTLPQTLAARTILVLGDSLSAAYGMPVDKGWVQRLKHRLDTENRPWTLINDSISGDTSASARARLQASLERHSPSIVLLEIGGNDGLRGLPTPTMRNNLAAMIEAIQGSDARLLLIGVQLPPNYGPRYTAQFEAVYRELAETYNTALLPSLVAEVGSKANRMQADGIHPNIEAQEIIAEAVWEQLQPLLQEEKPRTEPAVGHENKP